MFYNKQSASDFYSGQINTVIKKSGSADENEETSRT